MEDKKRCEMLCSAPVHMTELARMILSEEPAENPSLVMDCTFDFEGSDDQDDIDVDRYELTGVKFYVKDKTLHVVGVSSEPELEVSAMVIAAALAETVAERAHKVAKEAVDAFDGTQDSPEWRALTDADSETWGAWAHASRFRRVLVKRLEIELAQK